MATVAMLGIGRIGLAVTRRLTRAGHEVHACDPRADVAGLLPAGAAFVPDAADAIAGADVIITALPGSPELEATMRKDGLLERLGLGTVWIDLTSAAPDLGAEMADAARAQGLGYLDAPVAGGPDAVGEGTATLYVGGEPELLDTQRALLSTFAQTIKHMGPQGSGYVTKLIVNLLWFSQAVATGEALLLARRAGLSLDRLVDALRDSPASSEFLHAYVPRLLHQDYVPSFGLDRCVEELDSIERLAAELGTSHELISAVARVHRAALTEFGSIDGELMGIAYLERDSATSLTPLDPGDRPDSD